MTLVNWNDNDFAFEIVDGLFKITHVPTGVYVEAESFALLGEKESRAMAGKLLEKKYFSLSKEEGVIS